MKHNSIKLTTPCEFINVRPLNPLISKCQIKVCYVGEQPNRNKSIITKEVAKQMANSLPGSPIVGYFNDNTGDFEEHNRTIDIHNGKFEIKDATRPYGFVDLGARCWFQKYLDDDMNEREYLVTEGYLWTGQYPECQRSVEQGNNQSMELDKKTLNAHWTKDGNEKPQFFIINEAIVSKLCILGDDCEPCFEGASVTGEEYTFSFDDGFKKQLFSMMQEIQHLLVNNKEKEKGGAQVFTTYAVKIGDSLWNALYDNTHEEFSIERVCEVEGQKFAVLKNNEGTFSRLDFSVAEDGNVSFAEEVTAIEYASEEESQFALADVEAFETEYKKNKEEEDKKGKENNPNPEDKPEDGKSGSSKEGENKDGEEDDEEKKKEKEKSKCNFNLEEIPEYVELSTKFSKLESKYNALTTEKEALDAQLQPLMEFKANAEKAQKEELIKSFYMLSDEDKKDVVDNIATYSLDEIEAKLSILCVRNKVNFVSDNNQGGDPTTYNLGGSVEEDSSMPAWVKAALDTAKTLN